MPRTVQDIMNRELLSLRPDVPAGEALQLLRTFKVGAAPVVDETRRPIGVIAIRDLAGATEGGGRVDQMMSRPAITVSISATVEQAAHQLANMDKHHVVVVDGSGAAVGMVSTLDALRALLDLPSRHPDTFPHWDEATGASWTDEWALDVEAVHRAPELPGVLVLATGRLGQPDTVVWAEAARNLRDRVRRLATAPKDEQPTLRAILLRSPGLRFRAAAVSDDESRARLVGLLRQRMATKPAPGGT